MANFVLGMNGVAYISATPATASDHTTVSTAVSAATAITNVKDLKCNLQVEKADITTRANTGWKATAPTLKDGTITFQMVWKPGDTNFGIMLTAWSTNAEIFFA